MATTMMAVSNHHRSSSFNLDVIDKKQLGFYKV